MKGLERIYILWKWFIDNSEIFLFFKLSIDKSIKSLLNY